MTKQFLKDSLGWGFILWLIGYALGMILFFVVPPSLIGWVITPIGIAITLWVLLKKVKGDSFKYYLLLAVVWTLIAVTFDYLFIVKMFKSAGYYKLDVYLYYILTLVLPLLVGWRQKSMTSKNMKLKLQNKTEQGLRWIAAILDKNNIPYKIGGGLAAKVYGSPREVNDIDISISGKHFPVIIPEVAEYITAGPKHYSNEKWDCNTLSLNYQGQDIDLTDIDTLKMSNLDKTEWFNAKERRLFGSIAASINGADVSIMDPRDLLAYKKELGGEHQLIDIEAIQKYLNEHEIL